ncbi:MAG: alpha/beta fold hydrolase [Bradyrhizobium sp.]
MTENNGTSPTRVDTDWTQQAWLWPLEATRLALDSYAQWFALEQPREDPAPLEWTTPNVVKLDLQSMQLRSFSHPGTGQSPVLVCAPYALHRALIADFAPGHSLVETLRNNGVNNIHLTDWRSASPDMCNLSIDNYLADLNVAIDEIGAPADLVGLCQGGWLSLLYAARFPGKVRRIVLAGTPVDVSTPSTLSTMAKALPRPAFAQMLRQGNGIVSGEYMLRFWNKPFSRQDIEGVLQRGLDDKSEDVRTLLDRFQRWDRAPMDLPGIFYLEVIDRIFCQNQIAQARFAALGRSVDLAEVRVPVFLLAGDDDTVVPRDQAFATGRLLGTPPAWLEQASSPCGHLGLFMGRDTLSHHWRGIARWLQADLGESAGARMSA